MFETSLNVIKITEAKKVFIARLIAPELLLLLLLFLLLL